MADSTSYNQRSVAFPSNGLQIRGSLCLPNGNPPHPIVILGHGFGGLKEWTILETINALVDVGIAGLGFDFRNFGDSEGAPREEVAHLERFQNWQDAITYAASLPELDPQRIGIWGTSLGGRDVLAVASIDRRVQAVIAQAPLIQWSASSAARMAGFGEDLERYQQELAEDRQNRHVGKEPRYLPFVGQCGDDAKREFIDSLSTKELRNYQGRITLQSYAPTILTDITPLVAQIAPTPVRFILARDDALPGQRQAYDMANEPKSLVIIEGHHFSPYTRSRREAIVAAQEWFAAQLLRSK